MDDKLFAFLTTSGGLVVGWTLNELGTFFKNYRENKKVFYQILSKQLEIREVILRTNIPQIELQIKSVLLENLPSANNEGLREIVAQIFNGFIRNELNNRYYSSIITLLNEYSSSISALSQIDPFTTYYISNKGAALDYLSYIDKYLKGVENYLNQPVLSKSEESIENDSPENFNQLFDRIKEHITPFIRESAIEIIEKDIKIIAKKISRYTFYKTNRFLKKTAVIGFDDDAAKKIKAWLNTVSKSS